MRFALFAWLHRLTIGHKLLVSFGLVLAILGLSLAAILLYLSLVNSYVDRHQRITVPAIVTAANMQRTILEVDLLLHQFLEDPAAQKAEDTRQRLVGLLETATRDFELYRSRHAARTHPILYGMLVEHGQTTLADQEDAALSDIAESLPSLPARWQRLLFPSEMQASAERDRLAMEIDARMARLNQALQVLVDAHTRIDMEMKKEGDRLVSRARLLTLGLVLLLGVVIAGTYWLVTRHIARPLTNLAFTADRVARQDLSASFTSWPSQDEVGALSRSLATMLGTLQERTHALERKTKELEAFTYSVAHDLKGPLREIEGFSSLLERQHSGEMSETTRRYVSTIRGSALRLSGLIDDLLRYARLEQQALTRTSVPLKPLIQEVLQDQAQAIDAADCRVTVECPDLTLPGDAAGLRQVFVNLVANALKFSREARPPELHLGARHAGPEIIVWVKDNGIGFKQNDAEKIFGLFERLHGPDRYEGTGVGLAIVKLIVEKHGGRVWAESNPGKGATFYVAFPSNGQEPGLAAHDRQRSVEGESAEGR